MDYRELLKKYIAHVIEIQGVDFITMGRTKSSVPLTIEERAALDAISEEAELASAIGTPSAQERPTLDLPASSNLTALFALIGAYIRQAGPVNLEFFDRNWAITTEQDTFLRYMAERVIVLDPQTVLTDDILARILGDRDDALGTVREAFARLARGDMA